jgi:glycosyltransferase involved in cell wall biosynthesis
VGGLIVHDWIERNGGAEQVLDEIASTFPDASIACLWNDAPGRFDEARVHETWLARSPLRRRKAMATPFMLAAWRNLPLDADWLLCSSHLFAHHARLSAGMVSKPKLIYTHTPARYIWTPELDARGTTFLARAASKVYRPVDRRRAHEASGVLANSEFVRDRIFNAWGIDAEVLHPPVDIQSIESRPDLSLIELVTLESLPEIFVLGASRFVPYKQLEKVIDFANSVGVDAVIAGSGPHESALRKYARQSSVNITFVIGPSDSLLAHLYVRATAFIFPAVEDFGIMPVEAMAAGTPVVALNRGGSTETVIDGKTGVLLSDFEHESARKSWAVLLEVVPEDCRVRASDFSAEQFRSSLRSWVDWKLDEVIV